MHVCVLKILGLVMPMHTPTFHQDFLQLIFQQGGLCPSRRLLKTPYSYTIKKTYHTGIPQVMA